MGARLKHVDPSRPQGVVSRAYALADRVFAPYASYRREAAKAGRAIPIVQLSCRSGP